MNDKDESRDNQEMTLSNLLNWGIEALRTWLKKHEFRHNHRYEPVMARMTDHDGTHYRLIWCPECGKRSALKTAGEGGK